MRADGREVEEVVADKGSRSDATLVALEELEVRSYISEPDRGRRRWQDKRAGETPPEKRAAQKVLYANRRRSRGARGRRLQRRRGELVERPFAHQYETGGLRRVWVRGHENVRKRVLIQVAACNLALLLRRLTGIGTARSLQGRALSAVFRWIECLVGHWGRLTPLWGLPWAPTAIVGPTRSSPHQLIRRLNETHFCHGLITRIVRLALPACSLVFRYRNCRDRSDFALTDSMNVNHPREGLLAWRAVRVVERRIPGVVADVVAVHGPGRARLRAGGCGCEHGAEVYAEAAVGRYGPATVEGYGEAGRGYRRLRARAWAPAGATAVDGSSAATL